MKAVYSQDDAQIEGFLAFIFYNLSVYLVDKLMWSGCQEKTVLRQTFDFFVKKKVKTKKIDKAGTFYFSFFSLGMGISH
jgi:hypothetical protein